MSKHEFYKYSKRLIITPIEEKLNSPLFHMRYDELEVIKKVKTRRLNSYKKAPKPPHKLKKESYLKGLRFSIKGRLKGARRARTMVNRYGSIGPNTYNKRSKSNQQVIFTK